MSVAVVGRSAGRHAGRQLQDISHGQAVEGTLTFDLTAVVGWLILRLVSKCVISTCVGICEHPTRARAHTHMHACMLAYLT